MDKIEMFSYSVKDKKEISKLTDNNYRIINLMVNQGSVPMELFNLSEFYNVNLFRFQSIDVENIIGRITKISRIYDNSGQELLFEFYLVKTHPCYEKVLEAIKSNKYKIVSRRIVDDYNHTKLVISYDLLITDTGEE